MIRAQTLGTSLIHVGRHRFTPTSTKRFAFLLYLAVEPGRHHPRSVLHSLFFPAFTETQAKHGLRELVYQLRQAGVVLETDSHGLQISPTNVWRDWEVLLAETRLPDEAISLIEGGFLPGYDPDVSEEYSAWLSAVRGRIVSDLANAMLREIDRARTTANWKRAEHAARACLAVDPMNSKATSALAEMLARGGSATKAAELIATYAAEVGADAQALSVSLKGVRHRIEGVSRQVNGRNASSTFAGRDTEMTLLANAFGEVKRSGSSAVVVSGEPGIGKSRLLSEFSAYVALESGAPIATAAHPHDTGMPLTVIRNLSKALLAQPGALGCSPGSMEWVRRLMKPDGAGPFASAEATSAAISSAVIDLINAVSAETPLVLLVDDAQWADRASLELLESVAVSPATSHVLIVLGARDAQQIFEVGYWGTHFAIAELAPLDRSSAISVVTEQLGEGDADHRALIEWMVELAGGNPFFLETVVAHFRSTNERFSVPRQLNVVIDQRIGALTAEAREVLEAVVALGRHATISRLEKVMDSFGPLLVRVTRQLEQRRLIRASEPITPFHWLIAESVERHGSPISRSLLFRRIATILEAEVVGASDSSALWDCAEAWLAAGDGSRAAAMFSRCAEQTLSIGRAAEAAELFFRAAGLVRGVEAEGLKKASLLAALSAGEMDAIRRASAGWESPMSGAIRDEVDLAILRAQGLSDQNIEIKFSSLIDRFRDDTVPLDERLQAARTLLVVCDQSPLIQIALSQKTDISALLDCADKSSMSWLSSAVVFHAIIGDTAYCVSLAEELIRRSRDLRADLQVRMLRTALKALHRVGFEHRALEVLPEAYEMAKAAGLKRQAAELLATLASLTFNAGFVDESNKYFCQLQEPETHTEDWTRQIAYLAVSADFALYANDRLALRAIGRKATDLPSDNGSPRLRRWRTALVTLKAHLDGQQLDLDDLSDQLTAAQVPGHESGDTGDFEVAVLLTIMTDRGAPDRAKAMLKDYLERVRHPASSLGMTLRRIASALTERIGA